MLSSGLESTVELIQSYGHSVVLVQSVPTYRNPLPIWTTDACVTAVSSLGSLECDRRVPESVINSVQGPTADVIDGVAARSGAQVLDLRPRFCPNGICSTVQDGVIQYFDSAHLTAEASRNLQGEFVEALRSARGK